MITKSLSRKRLVLAFAFAISALLIVGAVSYRGMILSSESDRWVQHSQSVLTTLDRLLITMQSVESDCRGFLLTGDQSYMKSYRENVRVATEQKKAVHQLLQDNPDQQKQLAELEASTVREVRGTQELLRLHRTQGLSAATTLLQIAQNDLVSDFQGDVRSLRGEEQRLLEIRGKNASLRLKQTKFILILGTLLGLLIALGAAWNVHRDNADRGLAEDALRESQEKYRMLLDGIQDHAIFLLNPLGNIVSWNAGAERIKGYTADEIIGQNYACLFSTQDREKGWPKEILELTTARGRYEEQGLLVRKDGSRYLANVTVTTLRDKDDAFQGFSVISRDLTESKESGAKYRGLLEAAPDAMVVVDSLGKIVLLNVQAEKQFGYRRDELVGKRVTNIIPVGFAERLIADGTRSAAEALEQQIGTGIELAGRRKDGSMFPIEIMLSPLESPEGVLVTAAIRDISIRKAAELNLVQMEERYRGLLEAAPDAMVVVNQEGEVVLLNIQAEKQFGYHRDEMVGQKIENIIPAGFAERLIADALRSKEDAVAQQIGTGIELNGRRKDGSEFPIEIMLSPLRSSEGVLVTTAIRDITRRKRAEADLIHKVEALKRSNEELGNFAYIASHDLQEPLRMVASYTQLLARRYKGRLDSDADEFISFAVDGASRMQRLIRDLLSYSRVQTTGKDLLDTSSEDALDQAQRNLRGALEDSGAVITHDPLPNVLADEMQLVQLFQNLVGNAVKYRRSAPVLVHISASARSDQRWIFSVRDNGLGIDSQYFERIFGMFQRLHKREEFEGTGIGLAICKKIVERHGGGIMVESTVGRGSNFSFDLAAPGTATGAKI
jgi:PAS domain S-box-containing protein